MHKVIVGICLCLMLCGCSLLDGPTSKIDTDGDGVPDKEVTADQAVAWGKRQEAAKIAEAEEAKQAAKSKLRRVERDFQATIDNVQVSNQAEVNRLKGKLDDSVAAIGEDLSAKLASTRIEFQSVGDTVNAALADIDRKASLVSGIVNNPALQGVVGSLPGGGIAMSLITAVAGGWIGRSSGRKAGEDKGWDDREAHQRQIDATWVEAHREAMLLAGRTPVASGVA